MKRALRLSRTRLLTAGRFPIALPLEGTQNMKVLVFGCGWSCFAATTHACIDQGSDIALADGTLRGCPPDHYDCGLSNAWGPSASG
eukprot:14494923-Alexandrium_andersonii.AAC.1